MGAKAPLDGRAIWTGADAAIPAGWVRDTDYDDKFIQGGSSGFTAPANGGNTSHDHTANTHTHTGTSHYHTFTASAKDTDNVAVSDAGQFGGNQVAYTGMSWPPTHSHSSTSSNNATITYQNTAATIATDNTAPPSIRAIIIKPDGAEADIPDDAICFTDETVVPTGFSITDGTGGTPDLDDKFIRGADTGNDGDTTGEGSANHSHTSNHTHTVNSHNHTSKLCGAASPWGSYTGTPSISTRHPQHHYVTLTDTIAVLSSDDGNVGDVSTEPAFVKLLGIQNTSGGATTPEGVIIGYVGAESGIPIGWEVVTATQDKQIKITTSTGEIGDTGGSDTHTHTTTSHNHTHTAHNHNGWQWRSISTFRRTTGATINAVEGLGGDKHVHTWVVGNATPSVGSNTFTMSTDDIRLEYRTMIFIKRIPLSTVHILGGYIKGGHIAA